MNLFVLSLLLGGSVDRIINLWQPQSLSFLWSGNWSPMRLVTMTYPKSQSRGQEEGTSLEQGHSRVDSLPSSLLLLAHTSLLLLLSQRAKSQPQLGKFCFQGRQVLRSHNCLVNHSGRSPQAHLLWSAPWDAALVNSCREAWTILSARWNPS